MTDAEKLCHAITESRLLCALCPDCNDRPTISYEPGATNLQCVCRKITLADWQPKSAMRVWNGCIMRGNFREKTIAELIGKFTNV